MAGHLDRTSPNQTGSSMGFRGRRIAKIAGLGTVSSSDDVRHRILVRTILFFGFLITANVGCFGVCSVAPASPVWNSGCQQDGVDSGSVGQDQGVASGSQNRIDFAVLPAIGVVFDPAGYPAGGFQGSFLPWTDVDVLLQPAVQRELKLGADQRNRLEAAHKLVENERRGLTNQLIVRATNRDKKPLTVEFQRRFVEIEESVLASIEPGVRERVAQIRRYSILRMVGPLVFSDIFQDEFPRDELSPATRDQIVADTENVLESALQNGADAWRVCLDTIAQELAGVVAEEDDAIDPRWESPLWSDLVLLYCSECNADTLSKLRRISARKDLGGFDELFSLQLTVAMERDGDLHIDVFEDPAVQVNKCAFYFGKFRQEEVAFGMAGPEFAKLGFHDNSEVELIMEPTDEQRKQLYWKLQEKDKRFSQIRERGGKDEDYIDAELAIASEIWEQILVPAQKQYLMDHERQILRNMLGPAGVGIQSGKEDMILGVIQSEVNRFEAELSAIEDRVMEQLLGLIPIEEGVDRRELIGARPEYLKPSLSIMDAVAKERGRARTREELFRRLQGVGR